MSLPVRGRLTAGMTILVLGATGKTGRRLVPRLRASGLEVRAASRSGEVRFDWEDRAGWGEVLRGVTAVALIGDGTLFKTRGKVGLREEDGCQVCAVGFEDRDAVVKVPNVSIQLFGGRHDNIRRECGC